MTDSQNTGASQPSTPLFADLALLPEVLAAVEHEGYERPSPIQAQVIPELLAGRDVLGVAQTGTGKTAAFALPLLSRLDVKQKAVQILCLAPTRELAIQVADAFSTYAKKMPGVKVLSIYGGADYRGQIKGIKNGAQIVVGTPGRVMDHMRRGTLSLKTLNAVVLDEADEMLRMGFIEDVEWVLEQIPGTPQTALFSATMPAQIKKITATYLRDPAEVTIKQASTTADSIRQRFIAVKQFHKPEMLLRVLAAEDADAVIIFVRTRHATVEVADLLQANGFLAEALNGDIAQNQREKTVKRIKQGQIDIIVATDVAARGLDVERITHVVNYDIPGDTEAYVHRIGRTGRAGREGDAVLFVTGREHRMLKAIERATRQTIGRYEFPSLDELNAKKISQLFARVNAELGKDLKEYESVIKKYLAAHEEADPARVAAAFASLEAKGEPFYLKPVAEAAGRSKGRGKNADAQTARPQGRPKLNDHGEPMMRYRLEVGAVHDLQKSDVVGAIANEAGIESSYIGKIHIHDAYSTVELPEGMPKAIFKSLKKVWVRGQQLQISKAEASDFRGGARPARHPKGKGSKGGKGKGRSTRTFTPRGSGRGKPAGKPLGKGGKKPHRKGG